MDRVVEFDGIVGYSEYVRLLTALEQMPEYSKVLVDLEKVGMAHPSFMVPAIATIRHLVERGWSIDFSLPSDPFLCDYFEKVGWIAGISGAAAPPSRKGATYTPMQVYSDRDELNPIIRDVVDHFASVEAFGAGVLEAIDWTVNEIADNVLLHAGGVPGWVQIIKQPRKHLIEVVVADTGRGITDSLRERFPDLADDREALMLAVEKGITRDPEVGQGNGLAGSFRIAVTAKGWVNIHSGNAALRYLSRQRVNTFYERAPTHQGTLVEITLPTDKKIDVVSALWGSRPTPIAFEAKYIGEGATAALFRVADEGTGFGNRASALPLRLRLENILTMFPEETVEISFEGVNLTSASFADEFIGRLVKKVGVATFMRRVRMTHLNELVARTLDAVIEQRLSQ